MSGCLVVALISAMVLPFLLLFCILTDKIKKLDDDAALDDDGL